MSWTALEGTGTLAVALKILIAFALGLPTGWERYKHDRSAGLRTFPLVSLASCAYLLAAGQLAPDSLSRLVVGVITGIGFIGGGSIVKEGAAVHGTATAASLWNMGALGVCVAFGNFSLALLLCGLNYLALRFLTPLEDHINRGPNEFKGGPNG
jgi:putative Mg2+ transporter-C (MgtC) family protein